MLKTILRRSVINATVCDNMCCKFQVNLFCYYRKMKLPLASKKMYKGIASASDVAVFKNKP